MKQNSKIILRQLLMREDPYVDTTSNDDRLSNHFVVVGLLNVEEVNIGDVVSLGYIETIRQHEAYDLDIRNGFILDIELQAPVAPLMFKPKKNGEYEDFEIDCEAGPKNKKEKKNGQK